MGEEMGTGTAEVLLLGLAAGVLVGLMGVSGGIIIVPLLAHVIGLEQHVAQGTSLLLLLPPISVGAMWEYWKTGDVDLRAGMICACGTLLGGYGGSLGALHLTARNLKAIFGVFLMIAAILLLRQVLAGARPAEGAREGAGAKR
jgi:uncharacterized protein